RAHREGLHDGVQEVQHRLVDRRRQQTEVIVWHVELLPPTWAGCLGHLDYIGKQFLRRARAGPGPPTTRGARPHTHWAGAVAAPPARPSRRGAPAPAPRRAPDSPATTPAPWEWKARQAAEAASPQTCSPWSSARPAYAVPRDARIASSSAA